MDNRELLIKYKGNACSHCGISVEEMLERHGTIKRLFEFNHIDPDKKNPDYDNLIRQRISTAQLDEVDKCVLLCRLCHGVVHAQNLNAKLTITVTLGPEQFRQQLRGQFLADSKLGHSFFTDEKILVWPYWVVHGKEPPYWASGKELWQGKLMAGILETAVDEEFHVLSYRSKTPLVSVKRMDSQSYHLRYLVKCQLLDIQIEQDEKKPNIWIRNGKLITRDGIVSTDGVLEFSAPYPADNS